MEPYQQFGAVAIRKGFITHEQLQAALDEQQKVSQEEGKWKLLGIVMLEMGVLDNNQLIEILRYYENGTVATADSAE